MLGFIAAIAVGTVCLMLPVSLMILSALGMAVLMRKRR